MHWIHAFIRSEVGCAVYNVKSGFATQNRDCFDHDRKPLGFYMLWYTGGCHRLATPWLTETNILILLSQLATSSSFLWSLTMKKVETKIPYGKSNSISTSTRKPATCLPYKPRNSLTLHRLWKLGNQADMAPNSGSAARPRWTICLD